MKRAEGTYYEGLDGLRAVAIVLVAVEHFQYTSLLNQLAPMGYLGVRLFFVISGFLITGILLKGASRMADPHRALGFGSVLKTFLLRRGLRIFPLFYLALLLGYLANFGHVRENIFWHLSYTSNLLYFGNQGLIGLESHLWSLAVEEQFYLVWPFLVLLVPRRFLGRLFVGVLIGAFLIRAGLLLSGVGHVYTVTTSAMDALGAGALLAYLMTYKREQLTAFLRPSNPFWWGGFAAFAAVLLIPLPFDRQAFAFKLLLGPTSSLACFWLIGAIVLFSDWRVLAPLRLPAVRALGRVSYAFYLFHIPVGVAVSRSLGYADHSQTPLWLFPILFGASAAVAGISWIAFESPILRLKERFRYDAAQDEEATSASSADLAREALPERRALPTARAAASG